MRSEIEFLLSSGSNYLAQRLAYAVDRPLNKPAQIGISITDACAARCVMCDIWKLQVKDELTAEEWITFLGRMREWLGPFWATITGGEPFQKPGFFDILKFCREQHIKTKVSSNGMFLKPVYLERILEFGPDFLSLSVDSLHPETHDTLRGTPGLHARCVEAWHTLRARDPRIVLGMATVVMEDNYRDLPDMVQWAVDQGVDRVLFQPLQPNFARAEKTRNWYQENPHWIRDAGALAGVIDRLSEMKRAGLPIWNDDAQLEVFKAYFRNPYTHPRPPECIVRYNMFNVDPHGNVNLCWTVSTPVGNVREQHPAEIWKAQTAQHVRERMRPCKAPCTLNCQRSRTLADQVRLFRFFLDRQGF